MNIPHFVQIGDAPVFTAAGHADLICRCGQSVLIKGFLPAGFLAIDIRCFRCGAITTTPGLPDGEILPHAAVGVERNQVPVITPSTVTPGTVLACRDAIARGYGLTQPRDAPAEPMLLSHAVLETTAAAYDRLADGRLAAHIAASPAAEGSAQGDHPFAWAVARLRQRIGSPGWSWFQQDDDAMAAMHVAALHHLLHCWGQHPRFAALASPLVERAQFLPTVTTLATAKLLFDAGNRVGFALPAAGRHGPQLHFTTPLGTPLSLAILAPDALQWRQRHRRSPQVAQAAVVDAAAAARGRVNSRNPGIVVLSASILQPDFDQLLVDSIHAAFRAIGRQHRGVAAIAAIMPKVLPAGSPDRVAFGYAFYPIRNPHFAGDNPIRIGSEQDFGPGRQT